MSSAEELITFGREAAASGLLASSCGNVSVRLDERRLAISAAGSRLAALTADDIAIVDVADGRHLSGARPSMETVLHRLTYAQRPSAGAILHCQSRAATLLACMVAPPRELDFVPEVPAYVRAHAYVPYAQPGSPELAESVAAAFADPEVTVVQMRNHGQVVLGATWRHVLRRATFFELACDLAAQGATDRRLTTIPGELAQELRGYACDA